MQVSGIVGGSDPGVHVPGGTSFAKGGGPQVTGGKPKVLVVDDNEAFREMVGLWLQDRFDVSLASDGHAGLEEAERLQPDLIILDIMMPGMSGFGFLQALQERETLKHIEVIVATVYPLKEDPEAVDALRPRDVLQKPFERALLLERIEKLLASAAGRTPDDRMILARKLVRRLSHEGLQVLQAVCGVHPRPTKVHLFAPEVIARDRCQEMAGLGSFSSLLHFGIVETPASLELPETRQRILELAREPVPGEAGMFVPLSILVPVDAEPRLREILAELGLLDRIDRDVFVLCESASA